MTPRKFLGGMVWAMILCSGILHGQARQAFSNSTKGAGTPLDFVRDIQPIFKRSCYACHGPEMQMGQLRLDSKALAFQGGISGKVIVPLRSEESLLVVRIRGLGDKVRMPLQGDPLTSEQIEKVRQWIDQGAVWPDHASVADAKIARHWAYVKPARPELPKVRNSSWARNPIDYFVLSRLEKEGLRPSVEATRETLIRRLSLDLIGLPPTIEEVDTFLADKSLDAYEKLVDRLLASPHYGERWARPWLDLARYADTNGYESDARRSVWKYRDWVINALNQDRPFDQFTIEQIAGDMLPNATLDQRIATGFHRNTLLNHENGVDQMESRWNILIDRVNTTAAVWLGTTLACAQCHNHKYDPFTQKEFYQFLAFFENTDYRLEGPGSYQKLIEPVLELPTPEQEVKRQRLRGEMARLEEVLQTQTPELDREQTTWELEQVPSQFPWHVLSPSQFRSAGNATLVKLDDQSLLVTEGYDKDTYSVTVHTNLKAITAFQLEVLPDLSLPAQGPGRSNDGNFVLTTFKLEAVSSAEGSVSKPIELRNPYADFFQEGFSISGVLDGNPQTGWAILPQVGRAHAAVLETPLPLGDGGDLVLKFTLEHQSQSENAQVGRFRLSASTTHSPRPAPPLPDDIRPILSKVPHQRTEDERKRLSGYYRSIAPSLGPIRWRLHQVKKELAEMPIVSTLVMEERPSWEKPAAYLRIRGNYLNKGERAYAAVPSMLHSLPESEIANRLGLARWLVDENNPLVARVTVNRFWEQFFGRGLVETSEDFGTRGDHATHTELLDWLATEFMQRGWSMKTLHRWIVISATYRQSSQMTPTLRERDPDNKLLARGPRFRLEAEMIRDVALAVSELMSRKIGGPSVFPFQPESVWASLLSGDKWVWSEGEDHYRRGLYTFWRRSAPYPSFINFDATTRELCTVRRIRTNTPLQALTTLNDPAFLEAAKALAGRVVTEAPADERLRAIYGYRLCASRQPNQRELDELLSLHRCQRERFGRNPEAAERLIQGVSHLPEGTDSADLAAWIVVSNLLLNLDQTLTKE